MSDIQAMLADYAAYHQTAGNKAFHRFGVPMIMLGLIGMLARVTLFRSGTLRFDAAMLLIVLAELYYLSAEWRLALGMLVISTGCYLLGSWMPLWLNAALFVVGWILQFIGHSVYEKRQPAFFRNFLHLLVGPLWILNGFIPVVKGV